MFPLTLTCLLALIAPQTPPSHEHAEVRRLATREVDSSLGRKARQILDETRDREFGAEIYFTHHGLARMARVERHYHQPGGAARPWGWHRGISLFAVVR